MAGIAASSMSGGQRAADSSRLLADLSRPALFAGLSALGFANGIVLRIQASVAADGPANALFETFTISAIVWAALYAVPALLLRAAERVPSRADAAVAAVAVLAFALPIGQLSWIALTGLSLYLLHEASPPESEGSPCYLHRGAWVLLATTGATFWGNMLLVAASDVILRIDAVLVGWVTRMPRVGNTVQLTDGTGYVWIAQPCSSLANVSLALLCWMLFMQWRGLRWSLARVAWCSLACAAVVAINVTRISMVVLHPRQFELIHGPVGANTASWLMTAVILGICAYGTRSARRSQF